MRRQATVNRTLTRPWIGLVAAWLLLFAQQAAHWHMAGHLGEQLAAAAAEQIDQAHDDDDGHPAAERMLHLCAGCFAAAGLAAPLPAGGALVFASDEPDSAPLAAVPPRLTFASAPPYRSRAPPSLQA